MVLLLYWYATHTYLQKFNIAQGTRLISCGGINVLFGIIFTLSAPDPTYWLFLILIISYKDSIESIDL